ncbi:NUDIX hydrolase [Lacihabitans lacunae]|uniref:NUDIX hydrolase n=1 Tax=Lacihabitans lacunae TaxID=1028214 RepID=A0ABV7YTL2_9BACT
MVFDSFISKARQKLTLPLPGHEAHKKLIHKERFLFKNSPDSSTRESAVLLLLYPSSDIVQIPLILRPMYDGQHGGQMALPGGKKEYTDENLERTALRETQEEIGIKALDIKVIGELTEVFIPVSNFIVKPYVGFIDYKPQFFPDQKEVDRIYELEILDFFNDNNLGYKTVTAGGKQIEVPGFEIANSYIWGATALIMNEFKEAILQA